MTKQDVNRTAMCVVLFFLSVGIGVFTPLSASAATGASKIVPSASVLQAVQAAQSIRSVPSNLSPALGTNDDAFPGGDGAIGSVQCHKVTHNPAKVYSHYYGGCIYGDPAAKNLMVVYGDSHAAMWASALESIASRLHWRLEVFSLPGCPVANLSFISYQTNDPNTQCTEYHHAAPLAIKSLHPKVIVVTSISVEQVQKGQVATPAQWQSGLISTFKELAEPGTSVVMIGDIPQWWNDDALNCLAAHMSAVQDCSDPPSKALSPNLQAEMNAAEQSGVQYVPTTSWVCASQCEPIVGTTRVYEDNYHFTGAYVQYLSGSLQAALNLPS